MGRGTMVAACAVLVSCTGVVSGGGNVTSPSVPGSGGSGSGSVGVGGAGSGNAPGGGGSISSTAGTGGGGAGGAGGATMSNPIVLDPMPLRRLTNFEYDNTVRDLFSAPATTSFTVAFPADDGHAGFRSGRSISETHIDRFMQAAETLAALVVANQKAFLPCDPVTAGESACASQFIRAFGARVFRRPMSNDQVTTLETLYATVRQKYDFASGIEATVEAMLQSPYFLYHLEPEEWEQSPGTLLTLAGHSMANRLSYLLWGTMPDPDLSTVAAGSSALGTAAQVAVQAERLVKDQRARAGMRNFFAQWLDTERVAAIRKDPTAFSTFDATTATALKDSLELFVDDSLWSATRGLETLMGGQVGTGNVAYVNKKVAPLFGLTSTSDTFEKVQVDPSVRRGILTHPALLSLLATPSFSHPIKRGVYLLDHILCSPLPEPVMAIPPFEAPEPGLSVRQQFEKTTEPAECQACHKTINPLGFAFEGFDAVGKYRTIDDAGKAVNTAGTVAGTKDINGPVNGAIDLISRLATSPQVSACLTKKFYTYATKHFDNPSEAPVLEKLHTVYSQANQDLAALIIATTQTEAFLKRRRAN